MSDTPEATADIEVLRCPQCDAAVPLGGGDEVACPACRTAVAIPASIRAARDAVRVDAASRARAAALYDELSRPPSLLLRLFGFVTPTFLVLGGLVLVLIAAYLITFGPLYAIARRAFHVNPADVLPDTVQTFGPMGLAAVLALLGLVLAAYARRRAVSGAALRAGLAARPPASPGGAACCRVCGAPLTVPAGARGVVCDYCRADNLVRVPDTWLGAVRAGAARLGRAIEDAAAADLIERRRVRRRLTIWMIGWAIVAGGLGAIIAFGLSATPKWELDDWPPSWRADAAGLPRPMHAHRALHHGVWEAVHDESAGWPACGDAERGASTVRGAAGACERDGCRFFWIVALRHGERIEVTSDDLPDGSRVRFYRHGAGGTLDPDEFDEQGKQPLAAGQRASFTAGLSAWYGVGLTVPDMQPSDVRSMCASIARP